MKIFIVSIFIVFVLAINLFAQNTIQKTQKLIDEVIEKAYPELKDKQIEVRTFESESDYFRAGFSFGKYLTFQKMKYLIYVNPQVFAKKSPVNGIRSIIAHELAHILYFAERNRFELLGLASLSSNSFTQKFEHRADLEAISRGYGEGLKEYRAWLYQNIPAKNLAEKQRNYFAPDEIEVVINLFQQNPQKIVGWRKNSWKELDYLWNPSSIKTKIK